MVETRTRKKQMALEILYRTAGGKLSRPQFQHFPFANSKKEYGNIFATKWFNLNMQLVRH